MIDHQKKSLSNVKVIKMAEFLSKGLWKLNLNSFALIQNIPVTISSANVLLCILRPHSQGMKYFPEFKAVNKIDINHNMWRIPAASKNDRFHLWSSVIFTPSEVKVWSCLYLHYESIEHLLILLVTLKLVIQRQSITLSLVYVEMNIKCEYHGLREATTLLFATLSCRRLQWYMKDFPSVFVEIFSGNPRTVNHSD